MSVEHPRRPTDWGPIQWALAVALVSTWAVLVARSGRLPAGDGPHMLGTAMRLSQMLWDFELGRFVWCLQSLLGPHPPGAYIPATLAYTVLGTGWKWVHLVAGAGVLLLCIDAIRRLGGGWIGVFFLAATGLVWVQAEAYGADLLAGACVVQSLSHLVGSERLSRRRSAWWWGAWMGAGFMVKYTAPIFLAAPCLVAGWWVVRDRRWRHLGEAFVAFLVVAGPWYATHWRQVMGYVKMSGNAADDLLTNKSFVQGSVWSLENISWYPAALTDAYGWVGALCVAVGLGVWLRHEKAPEGAWLIPILAVLGGWLVLNGQVQRQDRYLLPAIPLLAALVGSARARWVLAPLGLVGVYGAAIVFATWSQVPAERQYVHDWADAGSDWPWPQEAYQPVGFDPVQWRIDHGLTVLRGVHGSDEGTVGMLLDESDGAPGFGSMLMRTAALGFRWHLATIMIAQRRGPSGHIDSATFVGPFTTDDWPSRKYDALLAVVRADDPNRSLWLKQQSLELVDSWSLPRGKEGRVYRVITTPDEASP